MSAAAINEAIKCRLKKSVERLARAARPASWLAEGVEVSTDIEQLICEAGRLHDAVSLMHRLTPV